jgi:zinc protease
LSFSIEAKKESLNAGIELLGKILREPAFPEDEFEQIKARSINGMKSMITEPQLLASNELSRAMSSYPVGDVRYVKTLDETIAELEGLSLEQIIDVYDNQMAAATGEISIVGDFDPDSAMKSLEKIIGDWNGGIAHNPIVREASSEQKGDKVNIKTPDKANAVFLAGMVIAMNEEDEDSDALTLANFIFGGGSLSSRLGDRVRQKEGLSYGVGSSISIPSEGTDTRFTINAITNPENIDAVETAVMEELNRFLKDGPTDEEVESAKVAWLESRKVARSSDPSIASQLGNNSYLNRTFKYTAEREKRISELTADDIKSAFAKHISVDQLVFVRAGDFKSE